MPKNIGVTVRATKLSAYWVSVNEHDVPLNNGEGSITLEDGTHMLVWWMVGNPGGSLAIELSGSQGRMIAKVKESKIPSGETCSAGTLRFKI